MKFSFEKWCLVGLVLILNGCAPVKEAIKSVWGSSTRALEQARGEALQKDFQCPDWECQQALVDFVKDTEIQAEPQGGTANPSDIATISPQEVSQQAFASPIKSLQIFIDDRKRNRVVLMGIPGATDTTEVGIFFDFVDEGKTTVAVTSLSKQAKSRAAEIVFAALQKSYPVLEPQPTAPVVTETQTP